MKQTNWFERKFDFSTIQHTFPSILERLIGTPARIEEKLNGINPAFYTLKPDNKWAILEHIGHLSDLETLWQVRLQDLLQGKEELSPTDLNNTRTHQGQHYLKKPEVITQQFRELRAQTVSQLEALTEEQIYLSALHPRLKTPMRTIDLFVFVAEHDDHHLASISAMNRMFLSQPKQI
ncbi:DinB family protein [Rhodocytophaga rosea]|uniref:DinB family protein n=1 Tax=Rhodocytophaga rosea TaxID=2704465 RepID=A0A6C0GSP0_9BACT|nr:DinB family protein [Rhodocytophaga rosea]QHT71161.1 DinB family protein [Rhodocytophaga rosea]